MVFRLIFISLILSLSIISVTIFDKIYSESKVVIDEEFHLPQGLQYCRLSFDTWNPKITTLPGLYIISAALLSPFNACSTYWLRFTNFIFSFVNFFLIFMILQVNKRHNQWKNLLLATNLYILPPLFFFGNLYYTDTVSLTFVLLMLLAFKYKYILLASFAGCFSVIVRQTNIIWVGMVFLHYFLAEIYNSTNKEGKSDLDYKDLKHFFKIVLERRIKFKNISISTWCNAFYFGAVFLSFLIFLVLNKGIVVGDKTAHVATIHLTQIFYYLLFCIIFTWPYYLTLFKPFLKFVLKKKTFSLLAIILMLFVVYFNTEVHLYLLADNRHYTFYIWHRFYQKKLFRYLIVPVYYFGAYCFINLLNVKDECLSNVIYLFCAGFLMISQKMIEIRYFFVPYLIFRMNMKDVRMSHLCLELIYYVIVNSLTFNVFFNKNIIWVDFDYPQKLIW